MLDVTLEVTFVTVPSRVRNSTHSDTIADCLASSGAHNEQHVSDYSPLSSSEEYLTPVLSTYSTCQRSSDLQRPVDHRLKIKTTG